jgi:hypothetical protein
MMSSAPPLPMTWDGECFRPVGRFAKAADEFYVVGQTYRMVEHYDRSANSHRHAFAELREAFLNLREPWDQILTTEDALRKFALVKAGYCETKQFVCSSNAMATELHKALGSDYDWATVTGNVVTFYTAHSQSYRAMDRKTFQEAKTKMLEVLADLIDTTPEALSRNAREAA